MKTEKASSLRFGGIIKNRNHSSEMYRPDELRASEEAWICLNCPLPECNKVSCKRYEEEFAKIKQEEKAKRKTKK